MRLAWHIGSLFAVALFAAGCGAGPIHYDYSKEPDPRGREHVLGVADEVSVNVWGHRELSGTFIVPSDGKIVLPLIGAVVAGGRTPSQVRTAVSIKLKDYIKEDSAKVTVRVTEVNSYRFTVSGEVARANLFTPKTFVTVTEAIAMAGGFTRFADPTRMYILRDTGGKGVKKIPINYNAIVSGRRPEMNIVVLTGDVIHVP